MREPTRADFKAQVNRVLDNYHETDPQACLLSGMSLVAAFLAKVDGSTTMTPALVLSVVTEVGRERQLACGRIHIPLPPQPPPPSVHPT